MRSTSDGDSVATNGGDAGEAIVAGKDGMGLGWD